MYGETTANQIKLPTTERQIRLNFLRLGLSLHELYNASRRYAVEFTRTAGFSAKLARAHTEAIDCGEGKANELLG